MADTKPNRLWSVLIIVLIIVITVSAVIGLSRYQPAHAIEISLPLEQEFKGYIQISGAVNNPGIYPYSSSDSFDSLLEAAGGTISNTDTNTLQLVLLDKNAQGQPQKININRAEVWLLEALPGIGTTKANAIIIYREQNGFFKHISELMNVEGIGQALYDKIKDLITVTD
ncbi:MAG TPA: helix-hairpin-helix domain-containing protein [Dehalococcoidales bacterium]